MAVKNLIFDLGGVIVDVSVERTVQAFASLSGKPSDEIISAYSHQPEFFAYERGAIDDADFRQSVQRIFDFKSTDEAIDQAWNAMITGIPKNRLDMLLALHAQYRVIVLSNTNNIHLSFINEAALPNGAKSLNHYFHSHYYSHLVGMRKPEPEIYKAVLQKEGIKASETLFLDDRKENIEAADRLGIQTFLVDSPGSVLEFFNHS